MQWDRTRTTNLWQNFDVIIQTLENTNAILSGQRLKECKSFWDKHANFIKFPPSRSDSLIPNCSTCFAIRMHGEVSIMQNPPTGLVQMSTYVCIEIFLAAILYRTTNYLEVLMVKDKEGTLCKVASCWQQAWTCPWSEKKKTREESNFGLSPFLCSFSLKQLAQKSPD